MLTHKHLSERDVSHKQLLTWRDCWCQTARLLHLRKQTP